MCSHRTQKKKRAANLIGAAWVGGGEKVAVHRSGKFFVTVYVETPPARAMAQENRFYWCCCTVEVIDNDPPEQQVVDVTYTSRPAAGAAVPAAPAAPAAPTPIVMAELAPPEPAPPLLASEGATEGAVVGAADPIAPIAPIAPVPLPNPDGQAAPGQAAPGQAAPAASGADVSGAAVASPPLQQAEQPEQTQPEAAAVASETRNRGAVTRARSAGRYRRGGGTKEVRVDRAVSSDGGAGGMMVTNFTYMQTERTGPI